MYKFEPPLLIKTQPYPMGSYFHKLVSILPNDTPTEVKAFMGIGFLEDFWKYYQGFNNSKSPLKRAWSLIFRNLSQLIMLCAILFGNGSAGFKDNHGKYE